MLLNNLKALIVILPLIAGMFYLARVAYAESISPRRIDNMRNAFIAVTIIGFIVPNFWLVLLFTSVTVFAFGFREKNWPVLYLLLLCALPPTGKIIEGFSGINNFLLLTPQIMLAGMALLPAMLNSGRMQRVWKSGSGADFFFAAYMVLFFALSFRETSFTDGMRESTLFVLVGVLQYYVFSRWVKSVDDIKIVTAAITIPILALSAVAIVELVLHWHFYAQLGISWASETRSPYVYRGGMLRTYASLSGPIELGYFIMAAMVLSFPLLSSRMKKTWSRSGVMLYVAALFTTLSRGPWLGGIVGVITYIASGPRGLSRLFIMVIGAFFLGLLLLPTPIGGVVLEMLPFYNENAGDTITYRQKLYEVGVQVVLKNPIFGSENYLSLPEMQALIQGQGIIDIVNAYLQIALDNGLVGLGLFLGIHLGALLNLRSAMRQTREILPELSSICRAYFSAYIAILFVLATTSALSPMDSFMFAFAGLAVGLSRVCFARLAAIREGFETSADEPSIVDDRVAKPKKPASRRRATVTADGRPIPKHLVQYLRQD